MKFICCLPIHVVTTGVILKTPRIWQSCWHVSVGIALKNVICRCFVIARMLKSCLTATANRMSVTRCWPRGANWGGTIFTCFPNWKTAGELDAFVDITPDNLLHNIQSDILELESRAVAGVNLEEYSRSDNKRLLEPNDTSVTFHVCHSPQREVEILHDRLLAMLAADPTLTPRDIIVMVADIDSYSPFIQAVLAARRPIAIYRMPFLTVVRASPIRFYRRLLACCRCRTAALSPRMCWHYWMFPCWRRASTSTKKGCAISAYG